jgi:hypothetical protein
MMTMPATTGDAVLSPTDKQWLVQLEEIIAAGMQSFLEVGSALLTIRDRRFFREQYASFELYCQERWGLSRARAYQLMQSAKIVGQLMVPASEVSNQNETLSTMVDTAPTSERQIRPLAAIPPSDRPTIWRQAVAESAGQTPTAAKVEEVVARHQVEREPGDDTELEETERRANAEARRRCGNVLFDDRKLYDAFGKLIRLLDDRRTAFGPSPRHKAILGALNQAMMAYKEWQMETT